MRTWIYGRKWSKRKFKMQINTKIIFLHFASLEVNNVLEQWSANYGPRTRMVSVLENKDSLENSQAHKHMVDG